MIHPIEQNCCGCAACADICPKQCIQMKPTGKLGALLPVVNAEQCIGCNLCEKVCPCRQNDLPLEGIRQTVYSAKNENPEILRQSSSGGMFSTFAEELIRQGYIVFGAAFDADLRLRWFCADDKESVKKLCKSKYLQSDTSGVFRQISSLIKQDKKVMFTGTPCQCKALRNYLGDSTENILIVDFFCHGVPSQQFFDDCKKTYENKKHCQVLSYEFRTKVKNGTTPHYYTVTKRKKRCVKIHTGFYFNSPFYAAFQSYINLRESCYDCQFAGKERYSDITIGDFHEIERYDPTVNRFEGISMVVVNTEKGQALFERCKPAMQTKKLDLEELIRDRQCFCGGTKRPPERDRFICDYEAMEFASLLKKWFSKKKYWKQMIYYRMPKQIRRIMKKAGIR